MSARRRLGAALTLVVAIAVVIGIVLAVQSPSTTTASNAGRGSGTTTVQRRDLVQTDTESGTLSYANPRTVYNRLSGTITWLPSVGQVIKPGQTLYKVNGEPVVLMNGTTPAYRDLSAADSPGQDILQLNRDLVALGFTSEGIAVDDTWQAATTAAVEVFQESLGDAPTGILTLGQVAFLPGNQVVSAVDASLGSDGGGGSGATPSSAAADTAVPITTPEFVSLANTTSTPATTTPTTPTTTTTPATTRRAKSRKHSTSSQTANTLAALIALLKAESAQLQAETARLKAQHASPGAGSKSSSSSKSSGSSATGSSSGPGASSGSGSGSGGGSGTAILQTSSTQLVVTVDLDATKQSEAKVGENVTVDMPAGNTVEGRITAVSPVAQSSSSSGNGSGGGSGAAGSGAGGNGSGSSVATIPVTIALTGHQSGAGLDQAAVSVSFAQARATGVLSVPVTALLATAGGAYAVQEAASPHTLIPVTTGLFAAGYVQISGQGIYPGLEVTDSQG
jgi:hypothetical protein